MTRKKILIPRNCNCGKPIQWEENQYCSSKCAFKYRVRSKEERMKHAMYLENNPSWKDKCDKKTKTLIHLLERAKINIAYCMCCHKRIEGRQRQIHHIDKNRENNALSNLRVFCISCHRQADGWGFYKDYALLHNISQQCAWGRFHRMVKGKVIRFPILSHLPKFKMKKVRK